MIFRVGSCLIIIPHLALSFAAPVISQRLIAFNGPMPNIISLPYGRCPPLHVQAPTWRHLLKLFARLGATRIEPTVEAMAVNRGELQLRTVIQFVRVSRISLSPNDCSETSCYRHITSQAIGGRSSG